MRKKYSFWLPILLAIGLLTGCVTRTGVKQEVALPEPVEAEVGPEDWLVEAISKTIDESVSIAKSMADDGLIKNGETVMLSLHCFMMIQTISINIILYDFKAIDVFSQLPETKSEELVEILDMLSVYFGMEPYEKLSPETRECFIKEYFERKFGKNVNVELPESSEE